MHILYFGHFDAFIRNLLSFSRAAQYACTLIGYTLQRGGASADLHKRVLQLEAHMSLTRKCEQARRRREGAAD